MCSPRHWCPPNTGFFGGIDVGARERIADAIKRIQTEGGDGNFAICHVSAERNYYVQFSSSPSETSVWAEAVSNAFLYGPAELTPVQEATLIDLGWSPPDDPDSNYTRQCPSASDADRQLVAELAWETLRTVYGAAEADLDIEICLE